MATKPNIIAMTRKEKLMPDGEPRYVRCYDNNGESADRYTVVFGKKRIDGVFCYLGMSAQPFHPQGVGMHGESSDPIDRPAYGHLGKRIKFGELPSECRRLVLSDYVEIWNIKG